MTQEMTWQTCSCLGGWHYDTRLAENGWYKSASDVVKLLVDVVSVRQKADVQGAVQVDAV